MDSVVPYFCNFFRCSSSLRSMASITDHHKHNGPSRVSVPKHLNSWNLGTGTTSLIFMTNQQDGPSCLARSFMHYIAPNLIRLPHLPSASFIRCHLRTVIGTTDRHKLRNPTLGQTSPSSFSSFSSCHLRTVTSMTDRHKLRRWSLLHFFAQNLRINLWTDFLQNKEKLI